MTASQGPLRQSWAWWSFTYGDPADPLRLLPVSADMGYMGVEMLPVELWPHAAEAGLQLATHNGQTDLRVGFNDRGHHEALRREVEANLLLAERAGVGALIVFAGDRNGRSDTEAADITAEGLAPLAAKADDAGVTLVLELLNSRVDHPGQQGDTIGFCAAVVEAVDSRALRVLYDIYHAHTMGADAVDDLIAHLPVVGHVHTAGAPGRRDIDGAQEIDYSAALSALARAGYDGIVGHEFVPRGDPVDALRRAYELTESAAARPGQAALS